MDAILYILLTLAALLLVAHLRSNLVFKCRTRALQETSRKAKAAIARNESWKEFYEKYNEYESYYKMFWDVRKWTYTQFYPGI
jgi:hypothetical protein